jgi:hypothetical protein
LDITGEQYDKLVEGREYWFMVQFVKKDEPTNVIVKEILDQNPMGR